jgi:hypothetical protein
MFLDKRNQGIIMYTNERWVAEEVTHFSYAKYGLFRKKIHRRNCLKIQGLMGKSTDTT